MQLDSKAPSIPVRDYTFAENRYRTLLSSDPERAEMLVNQAQKLVANRWNYYKKLSEIDWSEVGKEMVCSRRKSKQQHSNTVIA